MKKTTFTKMHGLGNDFVLIDAINTPITLTTEQIKMLADRKYGVGCDQVLLIEAATTNNNEQPTTSNINVIKADFNYRIFNCDGTEVEHCGNGARCVIEYLLNKTARHYYDTSNQNNIIYLQTKNHIISGYKNNIGICISMGNPEFTPTAIPFNHSLNLNNIYNIQIHSKKINFGVVSIGNPHAIIELNNIALFDHRDYLANIAKTLQQSDLFPNSVNVNFFVKHDQNTISLLTYERGVGFTLACGTGATATACYGILQGYLDNNVTVKNPGGKLSIFWDKNNEAILTGPALTVFEGTICL